MSRLGPKANLEIETTYGIILTWSAFSPDFHQSGGSEGHRYILKGRFSII